MVVLIGSKSKLESIKDEDGDPVDDEMTNLKFQPHSHVRINRSLCLSSSSKPTTYMVICTNGIYGLTCEIFWAADLIYLRLTESEEVSHLPSGTPESRCVSPSTSLSPPNYHTLSSFQPRSFYTNAATCQSCIPHQSKSEDSRGYSCLGWA